MSEEILKTTQQKEVVTDMWNNYDYSPSVFISSDADLQSEITANQIGHDFIFLKKQIYCPDCDAVLKKSFIVQAKADAYAEKHTSYKKYSTHNPIVRDIEYTFEMTISDIAGTSANRKKLQSLRDNIQDEADARLLKESVAEENELMPKIQKIASTLGIRYLEQYVGEHQRICYNFETYSRKPITDSTIRMTYDVIMGDSCFPSGNTMFTTMKIVAFYLTQEHYNQEQMSRAFPNANYGQLVLHPILA